MIISQSLKYIYIHVPKCGGTSITEYLSESNKWCDIEIGSTPFGEAIQQHYIERHNIRKHIPGFHLKCIVGNEVWNSYYKFATVRSPYTRFESVYNFLTTSEIFLNDSYARYVRNFRDINHFAAEGDMLSENVPDYMFLPQVYWLGNSEDFTKSKSLIVDDVFKLESINSSIDAIEKKIGLRMGGRSIPISNTSITRLGNMTRETLTIIEDIYHLDFELLGYRKEIL